MYGSLIVITKKVPIEATQKIKKSKNITKKSTKHKGRQQEQKRNKRTIRQTENGNFKSFPINICFKHKLIKLLTEKICSG